MYTQPFGERREGQFPVQSDDQLVGEHFLSNLDYGKTIFDLDWLCRRAVIFIDTSVFLHADALQFIEKSLAPSLKLSGRHVTVLSRTIDHLEALRAGQGTAKEAQNAAHALGLLTRLQQANLVCDVADTHEVVDGPHATARLFAEMFVRYQLQATQCLITQDEALAKQAIHNSQSPALDRSHPVLAAYVFGGQLRNWASKFPQDSGMLASAQAHHPREISARALVLAGTRVVADTSALMLADHNTGAARGARFFEQMLLPILRDADLPLLVPSRVMAELDKHQLSNNPERKKLADQALAVLRQFAEAGRLVIGEDEREVQGSSATFADPVFVELMIRFQGQFDLCFITQDRELARTLLNNREVAGDRLAHVTFVPMTDSCNLIAWETRLTREFKRSTGEPHTLRQRHSKEKKLPATKLATPRRKFNEGRVYKAPQDQSGCEPFELAKNPRNIDNTPLPFTTLATTGDAVVGAHSGNFVLGEQIAAGGEGTIYATPLEGLVCKIYHPERLTRGRLEKLELMLSREVRIRGVCWPTEIVTTADGQFQGYLMPKASGRTLRTCIFGKPLLKRHFPDWTRVELTQLAIAVLSVFQELHKINVFVGDINAMNILVQNQNTISLVDMDSVQIGGFPCPVGTETFTPPERQGKAYTDFLRTESDELFAVTTLLWQILFPGNAPYSSQGGGEVAENIRNRRFAYGPDREGRAPVGAWGNIWSHLNGALKANFITVFKDGNRVPISEFIKCLNWTLSAIREGGENSEIFPAKPKLRDIADQVSATCNTCGSVHHIRAIVAQDLKLNGRTYRCPSCAAMHKITKLETTREVECDLRISPECWGRFTMTVSAIQELQASGRKVWCKPCRESRRSSLGYNNSSMYGRSYGYSSSHRLGVPSGQGGSSCFVATAAYQGIDQPEVRFLRAYRDAVLVNSVLGRAFIRWYYAFGPWLARPVQCSSILRRITKVMLDFLVSRLARCRPNIANQTGVTRNGP